MSATLNRRSLFALLRRPFQQKMKPSRPEPTSSRDKFMSHMQHKLVPVEAGKAAPGEAVAVIQGRRCIALTSFCAVCVERCPVAGAMHVAKGMPSVVADVCTGCGICHEVCPAPTNAVLMLPRKMTKSAQVTA